VEGRDEKEQEGEAFAGKQMVDVVELRWEEKGESRFIAGKKRDV